MTAAGDTRFRKGLSGNPRGRPKKPRLSSAFDIILERRLTVVHNGVERELTVDEVLQQRTLQDAIAGGRGARTAVLKMIAKREHWLTARSPVEHSPVEVLMEREAKIPADALLALGIARRPNESDGEIGQREGALLLGEWVLDAALERGRKHGLEEADIAKVRGWTRASETILWP